MATHIERLRTVFQRLREAGLKLKPSKCHLIKEEVGFLGHVVSAAGVATDERKVKAVREWPVPRNVHELRAFIGLCSYYRRYIAMFSVVCAPLHALTGKNVRFVWSEACDEAFQQLKDLMTSAPILAMPTDEDPYTLDVDASGFGIGAVLSQCQQGEERVICYASRSLSKAERNYCCTRRELLAVVYFVKYFRPYLLGRKFLIRTDHSALTWLRKTPEPIGQQARWCEILEEFDFDIHHRPGKVHGNADALSRKPCKQCGWGSEGEDALEVRNIVFNAPAEVADSQWSPLKVAEETEHDDELGPILKRKLENDLRPSWEEVAGSGPHVKNYVAQWERIVVKEGRLFRVWWSDDGRPVSLQLIPPRSYRREIMHIAHRGFGGGHVGTKKTKAKVQQKAYWSGWAADVEQYIRECPECAKYHGES